MAHANYIDVPVPHLLRTKKVREATGYANSTLYLRVSQGLWTQPVKLGARASGWPAHEVAALNEARIAGKSDHEIRALVSKLQAARNLVASVWHI